MKVNYQTYKILIAIVSLALTTTACNNNERLKAVEQFSTISNQVKGYSSLIIGDIDNSCVRREEIENQKLSMIHKPVVNDQGKLVFPLIDARDKCQKWIPVVVGTNQLNFTLLTYIESLGRLASENTVVFTENVQSLGNSIDRLGQALNTSGVGDVSLGETQKQAGIKIVDSLLNLWSSQFRYNNLKPAIICTDPYFREYTSLLQEIIDKIYLQDRLAVEENSLNSQYNIAYQIAFKNFDSDRDSEKLSLTLMNLQNDYKPQIEKLDRRKELAIAYIQILDETKELHHALANNFQGNASQEEIKSVCKNYFPATPNSSVTTFPFQSELTANPTIQQLKQADRLIKDYQNKVKPSIDKIN